MIVAFDTNILVYACDKREPEQQRVARSLLANQADGVLLWQVACEFLAASRKLYSSGFTPQAAWARLAELALLFPLAVPNLGVLQRAQEMFSKHGCAFWDAMIYAARLDAGVETLYSEDLPGCPIPGLQVINPFRS